MSRLGRRVLGKTNLGQFGLRRRRLRQAGQNHGNWRVGRRICIRLLRLQPATKRRPNQAGEKENNNKARTHGHSFTQFMIWTRVAELSYLPMNDADGRAR